MGSPVDDALDRLEESGENLADLAAGWVASSARGNDALIAKTVGEHRDDLATVRQELQRLQNKLNEDSQNFEIECLKAEVELLREERDTTTPLHALREKNRELRASLEAAEARERNTFDRLEEALAEVRRLDDLRALYLSEADRWSEEVRRLTEGLRHISDGRTPDGQSITVPAAYARAWLERNERLSANPPQGDAAEGSSPSDGGGA